jgi:thiamine-phosphate pyrophosphorylase
MVTDRRKLGEGWEEALVARVAAAARAGVNLIQVRERDLDTRSLAYLVERCVSVVRGTSARVLVNDRLDVALAAGAHGVHLRGESPPASRVASIAPSGFLIGRSVHAREEALAAETDGGLHFLVFGPVFETRSKPGGKPAGLSRLAGVVAVTSLPVLAIGGMCAETAERVAAAGAMGFAAIDCFTAPPLDRLADVVEHCQKTFDAAGRGIR